MGVKPKFDRYGTSEWVTLAAGIVIAAIQIIRYGFDKLGDAAIELAVLAVWILLIIAPLTLANIIRKARGLDTK